jgi:hypothetical protein
VLAHDQAAERGYVQLGGEFFWLRLNTLDGLSIPVVFRLGENIWKAPPLRQSCLHINPALGNGKTSRRVGLSACLL